MLPGAIIYNLGAGRGASLPGIGAVRLWKSMTPIVQQFIIHGTTLEGKRFRPSDWADRLSGVMSSIRPPGSVASFMTYSPYAYPLLIDGESCVAVDHRL